MSVPELVSLRHELKQITQKMLELDITRACKVQEIQKVKASNHLSAWDAKREFGLFYEFIQSKQTSPLSFFLQFSLMIERHASGSDYPKWSEGEHLTQKPVELYQLINPILLLLINKSKYQRLKLVPKIKQEIDRVIK